MTSFTLNIRMPAAKLTLRLALLVSLASILLMAMAPMPRAPQPSETTPQETFELPEITYLPMVFGKPIPYAWETTRASEPRFFGEMTNRSLQMIGKNQPCIAYGGDHLYMACNVGSGWAVQVVDSAYGVGRYASMVLDASRHSHIAYYDEANGALKYATWTGSAWAIQTIDQGQSADPAHPVFDTGLVAAPQGLASGKGGVGGFTSIAINPVTKRLSISYYDFDQEQLKLAQWTGSAWTTQVVDTSADVGQYSSLAIDPSGNIHIAYYDATNSDLKYAKYTTSWKIEVVDTVEDVGRFASLALTSTSRPRIAYYDTSGSLKYAQWEGWWEVKHLYAANNGILGGQHTSLLIDSQDRANVAYMVETGDTRSYAAYKRQTDVAKNTWGAAQDLAIDDTSMLGRNLSLAKDAEGGLYAVYYNASRGDLRFTSYSAGVWGGHSTVDSAVNVGLTASLALDSAGRPQIAHLNDINDDLHYTWWDGSNWKTEVVDTPGDTGVQPSLALDAAGNPHITYFSNYTLRYAYKTNGAWNLQTIDNGAEGGNVGLYSSLVIDKNGVLHVSYYDVAKADLKYARGAGYGANWTIQRVDNGADAGRFSSIAMAPDGSPSISYVLTFDTWRTSLRLAHWNSGSNQWEIQDVDTSAAAGSFTSLVYDSHGAPHIAYMDENSDQLRYASWDGSAWAVEMVDQPGSGAYGSLKLDVSNTPSISYFDLTTQNLKYTRKIGSKWVVEVIDQAGDVGRFTSLALDSTGLPRIAYYDATNGDLKYAALNPKP